MEKKKSDDYGIVYLLVNECMPGLVKIGKTSRLALEKRMKELFTTGVPLPFECVYACRVKLQHMDELEKALHLAFAPNRVNENREFFRIDVSQVLPIMKLMTHINEGDATAEVSAEIASELDEKDKAAISKSKSRRPPLDFTEMGLHVGDILVFEDGVTSVSVASSKKVLFGGEERSLTSVTTELLKKDYAVQPTPFWKFKGESLLDIYDRSFPMSEE
jgi:hypothetical protein